MIHILADRQGKVFHGNLVLFICSFVSVSEDTRLVCTELWETVLSFLTTLVQLQSGPGLEVLTQVLQKQWSPISGICCGIRYTSRESNSALFIFISILCWSTLKRENLLLRSKFSPLRVNPILGSNLKREFAPLEQVLSFKS